MDYLCKPFVMVKSWNNGWAKLVNTGNYCLLV